MCTNDPSMDTFYDREQDKLVDDEGNKAEAADADKADAERKVARYEARSWEDE